MGPKNTLLDIKSYGLTDLQGRKKGHNHFYHKQVLFKYRPGEFRRSCISNDNCNKDPKRTPTATLILVNFAFQPKIRTHYYMSRDARKPVFGVSDQVRHKPACTSSEKS